MECWRSVVGYEGHYEVSDRGRVRSVPKCISNSRGGTNRLIKGRIKRFSDDGRYLHLGLSKYGQSKTLRVHRMVLLAFLGPCPDGCEARHLDGDYKNNSFENLVWDTHINNNQDRIIHGTHNHGSRNGQSKLSEQDVVIMRDLHGMFSIKQFARALGVSPQVIGKAINGVTWKHVSSPGQGAQS